MRPVLLIAANFVREQRWPLILLLVWVLLSGTFATAGGVLQIDDLLFFFKQQAVYGIAFSAFLAASAIHNERRSRRILAVLSKGIRRRDYVAGLLLGVLAGAGVYCVAMGAMGTMMFARAGLSEEQLWLGLVMLIAACALTATVALFFSTLMTPIFATAATAVVLGAPAIAVHAGAKSWSAVLPVFFLMERLMDLSGRGRWTVPWELVGWAMLDAVLLWLAASIVFSRRDIAVAVE
ncbi:MAG: ABC transporter permease [Terriglobales bacterium]